MNCSVRRMIRIISTVSVIVAQLTDNPLCVHNVSDAHLTPLRCSSVLSNPLQPGPEPESEIRETDASMFTGNLARTERGEAV